MANNKFYWIWREQGCPVVSAVTHGLPPPSHIIWMWDLLRSWRIVRGSRSTCGRPCNSQMSKAAHRSLLRNSWSKNSVVHARPSSQNPAEDPYLKGNKGPQSVSSRLRFSNACYYFLQLFSICISLFLYNIASYPNETTRNYSGSQGL